MRDRKNSLFGLIVLYLSKVSTVLFGVIIIPIYGSLTTEAVFGKISLALTIISICLMVDFGISTVVSRRLALKKAFDFTYFLSSISAAIVIYVVLGLLFYLSHFIFGFHVGFIHLLTWGYLLLLVLNNIVFVSLSALHLFGLAVVQQSFGLAFRGILSLFFLTSFDASVESFTIGIFLASILQTLISLVIIVIRIGFPKTLISFYGKFTNILRSGSPLIIVGLSGSLFLNFDKIAVAHFIRVEDLGPYYLSMTLAMIPINLLAIPLLQYFQPKVTRHLVNKAELKIVIRRFGVMMLLCCVIPSGIIYFSLDQIVDVWLGDVEYKSAVLLYAKILIPFTIIGALGVIPLSVVTAAGEFSLHAKASFLLTFVFMTAVSIVAQTSSIPLIVTTVCIFHLASSLVFLPYFFKLFRSVDA